MFVSRFTIPFSLKRQQPGPIQVGCGQRYITIQATTTKNNIIHMIN